jgi:hypothetical protein
VPPDNAADVLKVALDEFKALRDEINQRATYCHTLINLNVLATGTLGGFVLSHPKRDELLLLLPVLNPVLGLLWLDHSYAIRNMGNYIDTEIKATVRAAVDGARVLRWEEYLDEHEQRHKLLRFLPLGVPILVLFTAIPLIALARVRSSVGIGWGGAVWVLGAVLTVSFLLLWLVFMLTPYGIPRFRRSPGSTGADERAQP